MQYRRRGFETDILQKAGDQRHNDPAGGNGFMPPTVRSLGAILGGRFGGVRAVLDAFGAGARMASRSVS